MGKRVIAVVIVIASACGALELSTTAQYSVVVSNNPYTFNGAGSQAFTVSAAGSGDDDMLTNVHFDNCSSQWTLSLDPADPLPTRICGSTTGSGFATATDNGVFPCPHTYTFTVAFSAVQPGTSSCNVIVETYGIIAQETTLMLMGIGSGTTGITVSPAQIDFGDVQIMTPSSPSPVTVKNNGSANVTVNGTLAGSAFQVTPAIGTFGLGPGSSKQFDVTCRPPGLGARTGMLSFSIGTSSGMTMLDCNGIDSTVNIAPTSVQFAPTLVGRAPPNQLVTISGGSAVQIESVSLDSAATAAGVTVVKNPQGLTIGSGQTIEIAYSAAAMHAAGPLGSLAVKVSSDVSARSVAISGEALLGGLGTNPASVEFGAVCTNDTVMTDIEVYASEAGDIELQGLIPPAKPFGAVTVASLPIKLGGNHTGTSATVRAMFMPTMAGDLRDKLVLASNIPNMGTTEVELHGIALAGGIAATPDTVHFGVAPAGTTTSVQQVQLTNCGTDDLMFEGAQVIGTNASEFTLIGMNPPRKLAPTESEIFMIVMQPRTPGYKTAQLSLVHDRGKTLANLDGTGEGGEHPKERETYYACSAGRGGSMWLLAVVLLVLRRRRRRAP